MATNGMTLSSTAVRDCFIVDHYYHLNRRFLHTLGLWPYQSKRERILRVSLITFFQIPLLVHQIYQLFVTNFEVEWMLKQIQLVLPPVLSACCYYGIVFNFFKVKLLYSRMIFDYNQISDEEEMAIVKKYANQSKWCTLISTFFVYIYGVLMTIPPVFNLLLYFFGLLDDTQVTLPIPIRDILVSKMIYYVMFFYEAIVIYIVTTTTLMNYATFILLVQHACSQFSVITMKIHKPFEKNRFDMEYSWYNRISWDEQAWIIDVIKRYARTTELVNLTNSLSEKIYLIEVALVFFLIMLDFIYILQFSTLTKDKREALMHCIYVVGSMFIVYLNFYVGQRLLDHSSSVYLELSTVPFYRVSTRTQKLLLFLMMRSTEPCALSIGGMFVSSHEFFTSLMQKASSYAMVCYTMR